MKSKVVVFGLGRSGVGAANLLHSEGHQVIVLESCTGPKYTSNAEKLRRKGIKVELGKPLELLSFTPWLDQLDAVVISPSIAWNHNTLNELRELGVTVKGEMGLAWEKLKSVPWIGITGTNGKTTVTHMLNHVLESNHIKAPMGGNMGNAAAELAQKIRDSPEKPDWLIMELSSYQLEAASDVSPHIGIWTNLTPDHLERHGTINTYGAIKRRLLENSEIPIYNADDKYLSKERPYLKKGIWISTKGNCLSTNPSDFWLNERGMIVENGEELFHSSELLIPGEHNLQNLLMVTAAARKVGLSASSIKNSLRSFLGVPHRLEKLGNFDGISVFNDSKATNFESAKVGLIAVQSPTIVLAGGQAKKGDASQWINEINKRACGVVLFGHSKNHLKDLIGLSGFSGELLCCQNLHEAIELGRTIGIKKGARSLLFSPACASFDQYKDYEERGEHFRELISPLLTN